jgi:anti-sigma regulatory factor (Ser/Thr protein kinase)
MSARGTTGHASAAQAPDAAPAALAGPGRPTVTMSLLTMTLPGTPASVSVARWVLRGVAAGSPRLDDLQIILSELATNAIRHSCGGRPGGTFRVMIGCVPGRARIEVEDHGMSRSGADPDQAPDAPYPDVPCLDVRCPDPAWSGPAWSARLADPLAEDGRGLVLVGELADAVGYVEVADGGHRVWAEVTWSF